MKRKPGDKITIKINGREVETVIDEEGAQRIPGNRIVQILYDHAANKMRYDLNRLAVDFSRGIFTLDEVREFYLLIGYSVSGFAGLSYFRNDEIENPVWDEDESNPEHLLFDLGEAQPKERRVLHLSVMRRKFAVTMGDITIEVRELSSSTAHYSGRKLKTFWLLTKDAESEAKSKEYFIRKKIIEKLQEKA